MTPPTAGPAPTAGTAVPGTAAPEIPTLATAAPAPSAPGSAARPVAGSGRGPSRRAALAGGIALAAGLADALARPGRAVAAVPDAAATGPAATGPAATGPAATGSAAARLRPLRPLGPLAVRGGDLSFTLQLERAGVRFSDDGRVRPVERILAAHGADWVRLRVWVNPPAGYSDARAALTLARRARRAGQRVLLDLHYSDFWADPAHQTIPAAWTGQDLPTLAATVRTYTRDLLRAFDRAGAGVDMVQVGNEITAGMLWPLGQLYRPDGAHWAEFATLVRAGLDGVRDAACDGHPIRTMIHIDRGGDNGGTRWFFDHLLAQGVDFDVIGLSYYPFWHGPLAALQANLADTAARYGRDIVVAETAYPWTLGNGDALENLITTASSLPDLDRFPPTPQGQLAYLEALRDVLAATPDGRGCGYLLWEPEWIPGVGWEPGAGNPNDNLTTFDWQGRALPALHALRPPAGD